MPAQCMESTSGSGRVKWSRRPDSLGHSGPVYTDCRHDKTLWRIHVEHPAYLRGDEKRIIAWSIEETKPAVLSTGLHTEDEIDAIIVEMHKATDDETMLFSVPRMNRVWGKK